MALPCYLVRSMGKFSVFAKTCIFFSGPETDEVILVSAAHCNFVCKVMDEGKILTKSLF